MKTFGMQVDWATHVPRLTVNWPHQVRIGRDCSLEPDIMFKFDGPWKPGPSICVGDRCFIGRGCEFNISAGIEIGADTLVASGCKFIDHDHGFADRDVLIGQQSPATAPITIGPDVWLGVNVVVLRGTRIGRGSVIAAGSVVRGEIPEYEVWGGVPARRLKVRSGTRAVSVGESSSQPR
jgi:acetyltransferase-like isoleucine patch superfamily enzyme